VTTARHSSAQTHSQDMRIASRLLVNRPWARVGALSTRTSCHTVPQCVRLGYITHYASVQHIDTASRPLLVSVPPDVISLQLCTPKVSACNSSYTQSTVYI
jgi:hypothetical protein